MLYGYPCLVCFGQKNVCLINSEIHIKYKYMQYWYDKFTSNVAVIFGHIRWISSAISLSGELVLTIILHCETIVDLHSKLL